MNSLEGDSIGMQLGGESSYLILLVMNRKGAASILSSKIKLGGDASAATDVWMHAEILNCSRSRELFVGISLEGCTLRPDNQANAHIYGRKISAKSTLLDSKPRVSASGRQFVHVLQANAPRNESKQVASR
jgi:lipid-binding SYLF domain-containing protein